VPLDFEWIRAKTQQTLIDFMCAELKLGRTFTESAKLAYDQGHTEHYEQAKRYAIRAADAVRRFTDGVADLKIRHRIAEEFAELDRLISTL
jgi:hypothetical protein